jgi:uncharacterized membrane protein YbhN (UPF0104 family)
MRFVDVATASLLTAACTIIFFLTTALGIFVLHETHHFVVADGTRIGLLLGATVGVFGAGLVALILCAAYPPLLKGVIRALAVPAGALVRFVLRRLTGFARTRPWAERQLAHPGQGRARLLHSVDEFHEGFHVYLQRGKGAYALAQLLTFGFFCSRFAVAYFILLALGLPTTPETFVTIGPPLVQVVLVQALINFALYLSPTPGASGFAEATSTALMAPWVSGAYNLPYTVLWRILALFVSMFVGGVYVFRFLGTDVLEERVKEVKKAEEERRAQEEARLAGKAADAG